MAVDSAVRRGTERRTRTTLSALRGVGNRKAGETRRPGATVANPAGSADPAYTVREKRTVCLPR